MLNNLFRVAAATPRVHIGNVSKNCEEIKKIYDEFKNQADVIITPELSMTGYTCADLFSNRNLLNHTMSELLKLAEYTGSHPECEKSAALVVGLPLEKDGELFNCAAMLQNGKIIAIIPKTYLPNYGEFYEKRWFTAGRYDRTVMELPGGEKVDFGNNN